MKFRGLMGVACAVAITTACTGEVREDSTVTDTGRAETADDRVGTTGTGGTVGVSGDARDFVEQVAHSSMAEVQLGQIASQQGQNPEVKQFGQMMVRDHTKAADELKQVVSSYNITLPTELDQEHTDLVEKLRNLRGAEFDREYMDAMVDGHRDMQGLLENRAEDAADDRQSAAPSPAAGERTEEGVNAALNQWALKAKPTVDKHLMTAERIQEQLQGSNSTN